MLVVGRTGFKLYYTDKLRDNDAMIMTLGHLNINIPPGAESHTHTNESVPAILPSLYPCSCWC